MGPLVRELVPACVVSDDELCSLELPLCACGASGAVTSDVAPLAPVPASGVDADGSVVSGARSVSASSMFEHENLIHNSHMCLRVGE